MTPRARELAFLAASGLAFLLLGLWQFPETLSGLLPYDERLAEYIPWRVEAARLFLSGEFPFFTSRVFGGMPLFSTGYTGVLYPPNWLYVPLGYHAANPLFMLHTVLGGLGMLVYLRAHRLARPAALAGAVFFLTGTFGLMHASHISMREAAMLAPWAAWAMVRLTRRPVPKRAAVLAAVLALQLLAGYPQVSLFTVCWIGLEVLAALRLNRRGGMLALFAFIGGLTALAIAAVQIIPALHHAEFSVRSEMTVEQWAESSFAPRLSLLFLMPRAFGAPQTEWFGGGWAIEQLITISAAAWALAIAAPFIVWKARLAPSRRRLVLVLTGGMLLSWLLALGEYFAPTLLLFGVPPFSLFRIPARWLFLTTALACVLSGFSLHALLAWVPWRRLAAFGGGVAALALMAIGLAVFFGGETQRPLAQMLFAEGWWLHLLVTIACGVALLIPRRLALLIPAGFLIATAMEYRALSLVSTPPVHPQMRMILGEEPHPVLPAAGDELERFFSLELAEDARHPELLLQNLALFRGTPTLSGYTPLYHPGLRAFLSMAQDGGTWRAQELFGNVDPLRQIGVTHLLLSMDHLTPEQAQDFHLRRGESWEVIAFDGRTALVQLLDAPGRFQFAPSWGPSMDDGQILWDWWRNEESRRTRPVLVQVPAEAAEALGPPPLTALPGGEITPLRLDGTRQSLDLLSHGPNLLVVRDAWWPGWEWRTTPEGAAPSDWQPVLQANGMLRAVPLERGRQVVELRFVPPGWESGLMLSALGAILLALLTLLPDRRRTAGIHRRRR